MPMKLDLHSEMILDEYRENLPVYEKISSIVLERLRQCLDENHLHIAGLESRIKAEDSLTDKLELKGYKYKTISDVTDIVGIRVITFFNDEVDVISALVEKMFEIDWDNSVDKRKMLEIDRFGYMSLHYICRLPEQLCDSPEMHEYRFEVQMRTALQHVWATIYHDLGYKSDIEIPRETLRNMHRIAGMMELADSMFSRIRMEITDYRRRVQSLVADGDFDHVPLDGDTFRSYLELKPFDKLATKIATINQAEIYRDNLMPYLKLLLKLEFKSLGDIERLIHNYSTDAYQLALHQISGTDLDIMALSVTLQNLCCVYVLRNGLGMTGLEHIFNALGGNPQTNHMRAERLFNQAQQINII